MRPRFEPDAEPGKLPDHPAVLIDPEAFDASEQQFAASLESARGRFVLEPAESLGTSASIAPAEPAPETQEARPSEQPEAAVSFDAPQETDSDSWRQEVTARLGHYRARRRPREPRYPSLRLKFDDGEPPRNTAIVDSAPPATRQSVAVARVHADPEPEPEPFLPEPPYSQLAAASPGKTPRITEAKVTEKKVLENKIIEFPRSAAVPIPVDELAEPVFDRPRILEALDVAPPGPALGGILIESAEETPVEKRPGFEIPLQAAPMARRLGATAVDAAIVIAAFAMFAFLFFKITASVPPLLPAASLSAVVIGILWTIYQYLMLVGTGTTPGLKLARLHLNRFDGSPAPRVLRRWRVLTSVMSGVSLGLGYAWCFFDEDQLCWHDRITRTYAAPER